MSKKSSPPTYVSGNLKASKFIKARRNCRTCRGRGYITVQHGYTRDGVLRPIIYGMPYIETEIYCPCLGE